MNTPWSHSPDSSSGSRAPYAGPPEPQSAPTRGAQRTSDRTPYVPAAFRTRPQAVATSVNVAPSALPATEQPSAEPVSAVHDSVEHELPWISAFAPEAHTDEREHDIANVNGKVSGSDSVDAGGVDGDRASGMDGRSDGNNVRADDWPFADAGAEMSELTGELPARDPFDDPFLAGAAPPALPMWNEDDMMDIMPVRAFRQNDADADADAGETGGEVPGANREAAARALEGLAAKVRDGELALPGYASGMGDAAALASALTALLGVRN